MLGSRVMVSAGAVGGNAGFDACVVICHQGGTRNIYTEGVIGLDQTGIGPCKGIVAQCQGDSIVHLRIAAHRAGNGDVAACFGDVDDVVGRDVEGKGDGWRRWTCINIVRIRSLTK